MASWETLFDGVDGPPVRGKPGELDAITGGLEQLTTRAREAHRDFASATDPGRVAAALRCPAADRFVSGCSVLAGGLFDVPTVLHAARQAIADHRERLPALRDDAERLLERATEVCEHLQSLEARADTQRRTAIDLAQQSAADVLSGHPGMAEQASNDALDALEALRELEGEIDTANATLESLRDEYDDLRRAEDLLNQQTADTLSTLTTSLTAAPDVTQQLDGPFRSATTWIAVHGGLDFLALLRLVVAFDVDDANVEAFEHLPDEVEERLARRYAPELRFHPDELNYTIDPLDILAGSELGDDGYLDIDDSLFPGDRGNTPLLYQFSADESGRYITYWLPYGFNNGPGPQNHEGDWERVEVRLDDSLAPTDLYYSGHSTPTHRSWGDAELTDDGRPVVYVSRGSHANYPEPGDWDTDASEGLHDPTGVLSDSIEDFARDGGERLDLSSQPARDITDDHYWDGGEGAPEHWGSKGRSEHTSGPTVGPDKGTLHDDPDLSDDTPDEPNGAGITVPNPFGDDGHLPMHPPFDPDALVIGVVPLVRGTDSVFGNVADLVP